MKKKSQAEYEAELAKFGKLKALGKYQRAGIPILHRCLKCGEESMIAPISGTLGSGCNACARKELGEKRRQKAAQKYTERLAAIGRLEALEPYINATTPILHRCLEHDQTHLTKPNNALSGKGLKCCLDAALIKQREERKAKSRAKYEARLAAIGKAEALEPYISSTTPILHRCLKHGREQMARPSDLLQGKGLKCCQGLIGRLKYEGEKYEKGCAEHGKALPLEPYKGIHEPILHRCLTHGEEHLASPAQILRGHGLKCCNCGGGDSRTRLLKDEKWANSPCHLYLARINGSYLKPGIAIDTAQRADDYYTGYAYISPAMTRAEAWAIEQCLLTESSDARPDQLPEIYRKWDGRTELRDKSIYPESWYISRYWELMEEMEERGWENLAASICQ